MTCESSKVELVIKQNQSFFRCLGHYYYNGGKKLNQSESEKLSGTDPEEIKISTEQLTDQNFSSEPILLELIHKSIRPCKKIWVIYTHEGHNGFNEHGQYKVNLYPLPGQEIPYPLLEYRVCAYNYIMIPDEKLINSEQPQQPPNFIDRIPSDRYQFGFVSHLECVLDRSMYADYGYQPLSELKEICFTICEFK